MKHVLIIEDDRDIRDALFEVLEAEGYDVRAAANGAEGLCEAHAHHPDLILLDLMMPVMNGWQFRAAQKLDDSLRDVPVVVMSAVRQPGDVDAAAFLPKPCALDEILSAVHDCTSAA